MKLANLFLILFASIFTACSDHAGWDGTTPNTPKEHHARDICDCLATVMEKAGIDIPKAYKLGTHFKGTNHGFKDLFSMAEAKKWEADIEKVKVLARDTECMLTLDDREKKEGMKLDFKFEKYARAHCMLLQVMR
ncbi:MAG: hypothetical protein AAF570_12130 [Bacteroidota bacterium]